jgi:exonuclease III
MSTDILVLAETNCNPTANPTAERLWSQDWANGGTGPFWASATEPYSAKARGMAIFFSNNIPVSDAHLTYPKPRQNTCCGRIIVVTANLYGRPTHIIGFHADCGTLQPQSIERLTRVIENLSNNHELILLSDHNHYIAPQLDYYSSPARPTAIAGAPAPPAQASTNNEAGRKLYASLLNKYSLQDTFRHLHPNEREYTRNNTAYGVILSKSRIDGIFISRALLEDHTRSEQSNYRCLTEAKHIHATQEEMCAIRVNLNTNGTADTTAPKQPLRWSDHCAVQITIQYADTISAPPRWSFPRYLLDSPNSVAIMRSIIKTHIPDHNDINEPTKTLNTLLTKITEWAKKTALEEKTKHKIEKNKLLAALEARERFLGTGPYHAHGAAALPPGPDKNQQIEEAKAHHAHLRRQLTSLYYTEQTTFYLNAGVKADALGESCWKVFFDHTRNSKISQPIQQLKPNHDTDSKPLQTQAAIRKHAEKYYFKPGGLLNLQTATDPQAEKILLEALTKDGKTLPDRLKAALTIDSILDPEHLALTIRTLTNGSSPGWDGLPNDFFKILAGQNEYDEDEGPRPSRLAHLLAATYREMLENGEMSQDMRTGVITLLFKDKGHRDNIDNYRPITVLTTLYKILSRAMALRLGEVIHHLVDNAQAAFQKQKRTSDVARLVQDIIDHCEEEGLEGFILFCDQHKAFDRVSWEFMQKVLGVMNLPEDFSRLTNLLYSKSETRMKINGHIGAPHPTSNGVRQGCGLSPLLYILVFQSLLSLINTSHLFNNPDIPTFEGIPLPAAPGLAPAQTKVAAFADDLTAFLQNASHLPAFKSLVHIYERGSLAKMSWTKTFGKPVGTSTTDPETETHALSAGIVQNNNTTTRILGVHIGPPNQVDKIWKEKTVNRVIQKFALWSQKYLPSSIEGKNTVIKNSVLACVWYLIEHQTPPDLDSLMTTLQKLAWSFHAQTHLSIINNTNGIHPISHKTLIQDHPEGGARAADVETFARAIYANQALLLINPPSLDYRQIVMHWINLCYGHLQQGLRLLISNCDFQQLQTNKCPALFWKRALPALGMMPGIAPNAEQTESNYEQIRVSALLPKSNHRIVTISDHWSLLDLLSEPLHYNPNINGKFGAALTDTPKTILALRDANRSQARLIRASTERTKMCQEYYSTTKKMAQMKCTHFIHLFIGLHNRTIGRVSLMTYEHFAKRAKKYHLRHPPLSNDQYRRLIQGITSQKPWQTLITWLCGTNHKSNSLRDLTKSAPIPGHKWYWFREDDTYGRTDIVEKTKVIQLYRKTPTGELLLDPSLPPRLLADREYEQAHVWDSTRKTHAPPRFDGDNLQGHPPGGGGNAESKTILLTNGIVANWPLLLNDPSADQPIPQGSDPSAFQYLPAPTDRMRKGHSIAETDIRLLYWLQITEQYHPQRTLDPQHVRTTTTSSSWTHLLKDPTLKIHEVRKALLKPLHSLGITQELRDYTYRVQQDALPIGPRCAKKGVTKGACALCFVLDGLHKPETTQHILFDCPYAAPILNAHQAFILATASPEGVTSIKTMDKPAFIKTFARRIIFGSTIGEPQKFHAPPSVVCHFAAAVIQAALQRRTRNSTQGIHAPPLSFDPDSFLKSCIALFSRSAKSTHFTAEREENRIQIYYHGWTPTPPPLEKWGNSWIESGAFKEGANSSRLALRCLIPTTIQQLPGAFFSPGQLNANSAPGSHGIDTNLPEYSHRLLLHRCPLTPPTTFPLVPMPILSVNYIATTAHPRPTHGGFPGAPPTMNLNRLSLLLMTNYPVIPMPLPAFTYSANNNTNPRPSHGGFPHTTPTPLLTPANTAYRPPTRLTPGATSSSAPPLAPTILISYPRALKRGGTRRPTPTTHMITNSSTHPQPGRPRQAAPHSPSASRHHTYTSLLTRGLPPGATTPPPYPQLPQQRWTRLEGARGTGLATPCPPLRRITVCLRWPSTPHLAG